MATSLTDYDANVLACTPRNRADIEDLMSAMPPNTPEPRLYTGSAPGECQGCQMDIWIGPRARAFLAKKPNAVTMCFGCAAAAAWALNQGGIKSDLRDLGNTEYKES